MRANGRCYHLAFVKKSSKDVHEHNNLPLHEANYILASPEMKDKGDGEVSIHLFIEILKINKGDVRNRKTEMCSLCTCIISCSFKHQRITTIYLPEESKQNVNNINIKRV